MAVSEGAPSYDVLVPLHQGLVPDAKLVQAVRGWDVSDHVRKAFVLFDLGQLLLKPLDFMAWVFSVCLVKQPPVQVVACLHVHGDYLALGVVRHWLAVVPVLAEDFDLFCTQELGIRPVFCKLVDLEVGVWLGEVLNVDGPCIVVSKSREDADSRNQFEDVSCDCLVVVRHLLVGVVPDVMR